MEQNPRPRFFSWIEWLVIVVGVFVLASLCVPATHNPVKARATSLVNNGRQMYLTEYQMAADGLAGRDDLCGWPGELAVREGPGRVTTVKEYVERLVALEYLRASDVPKILLLPPKVSSKEGEQIFNAETNCVFKFYRVTNEDAPATVLLASRNFSYGKGVDRGRPRMAGSNYFVVIRKGGDGSAYREEQAMKREMIGRLPGPKNEKEDGVETPEDTLVQR